MSNETLDIAVAEMQRQLRKREPRRWIAWALSSLLVFALPLYLFYSSSVDAVFESSYAPIVVVWMMVSLGVGNLLAAALFASRTAEIHLLLAMAEKLSEKQTNQSAVDQEQACVNSDA